MPRVICVVNQKGGVGKTTTSINLSYALANLNRKVLLIDMDPQGNASGVLSKATDKTVYHVLTGERDITSALVKTSVENLKALVSNADLVGAEVELVQFPERELRLKNALNSLSEHFDYVLIDCPPSLGLLTVNALCAADSFLVPLQCEYYALEGLGKLLNTSGLIKNSLNKNLKLEGIVLTMFDTRNRLSHQVLNEVKKHFKDQVFETIIPRSVRLSEAPSHGMCIFDYDKESVGSKQYQALAFELDRKNFLKTSKEEFCLQTL